VSGDERTISRQFIPNVSGYVVDRVARERTYEGVGTGGPLAAETRFRYDNQGTWNAAPTRGELTMSRVWDDRNAVFYDTQMGYDGFGNVVSEISPRGHTTTTVFDSTYHVFPEQICPPLIPCALRSWNPVFGAISSKTDPNSAVTSYQYDVLGRPSFTTYPDTTFTEFQYFNIGSPTSQRVRTIEPDHTVDGLYADRYFDGYGREWQMIREGGETQRTDYHEVTDRVDRKSLTYESGESIRYQEYSYDGAKRVIRIDEASSAYTLISYGDGFVTNTDPLGKQRTTYRDGLSRIIQTRERNSGANYDTFYDYDSLDNLIQVTDASSNVATFDYDSLGRKVGACDFDMGCWSYTFDADGNLLTRTDAASQTTTFAYDDLGRSSTKTNHASELTQWAYDEAGHGAGLGRLTTLTYPGGSESFTYDNQGQETQITRCVEGDGVTRIVVASTEETPCDEG
jgi:YD repeat-containing protein